MVLQEFQMVNDILPGPAATDHATHDPFGTPINPADLGEWVPVGPAKPDGVCGLCGLPLTDGETYTHDACSNAENADWSDTLPDDPDARSAWEEEQDSLTLRELEEAERIGNSFDAGV